MSEEETVQFETEKGIHLPKDYRRFITIKTAGGTQPFYGLYNPVKPVPFYECDPVPEKKFPYTMEKPLILAELSEEEQNQYFENDDFSYGELTEGSFKNMF